MPCVVKRESQKAPDTPPREPETFPDPGQVEVRLGSLSPQGSKVEAEALHCQDFWVEFFQGGLSVSVGELFLLGALLQVRGQLWQQVRVRA